MGSSVWRIIHCCVEVPRGKYFCSSTVKVTKLEEFDSSLNADLAGGVRHNYNGGDEDSAL